MCLSKIGDLLAGTSRKPVIGYKVVMKSETTGKFKPNFISASNAQHWSIGRWYHARYNLVQNWKSRKSGKEVKRHGMYEGAIRILIKFGAGVPRVLNKIQPTIGYEKSYECGFHYFTTLEDAQYYCKTYEWGDYNVKIVRCEFKGIITTNGHQFQSQCGVARRMKIINTERR